MAVAGPNVPSVASGSGWANPSNVFASDNAYATYSYAGKAQSNYLYARGFNFNIPSPSVIDGIVVEIEAMASGSGVETLVAYLVNNTTNLGSNQGDGAAWPTTDTVLSLGSSANKWGVSSGTLTPALVNSANFGVGFIIYNTSTSSRVASIDRVRMTVYYTVTNVAPIIASAAVEYAPGTSALGPNNWFRLRFTATDADAGDQGTDGLRYQVRTGPNGTGTLLDEFNATHGIERTCTELGAWAFPGGADGDRSVYLRVRDDDNAWSADAVLSVRLDRAAPTVAGPTDSDAPNPGIQSYSGSFTPSDAEHDGPGELRYEIRDAAGGGGNLLTGDDCTSGVQVNWFVGLDTGLAGGDNTRYLRLIDGAGNVTEQSFVVTYTANTSPVFTSGPVVTYADGRTAAGPNTTWGVTFTAHDDEQTGPGELSYIVGTDNGNTGLVTCTSDVEVVITGLPAAWLDTEGDNTGVLLQVFDLVEPVSGSLNRFITVRLDSQPPTVSGITITPDPVSNLRAYVLAFTPDDAVSTGHEELAIEWRTGPNGTGMRLGSGRATAGAEATMQVFIDAGLVNGDNLRYLRVTDAAGNVAETAVTVHVNLSLVYAAWRLSAPSSDAGNSEPSTPALSLGGYAATSELAKSPLEALFPNVDATDAGTGRMDYRCIFIANVDSNTWEGVTFDIPEAFASDALIYFGLDPTGIVPLDSGDPQAVTIPDGATAPEGVTFLRPSEGPLVIGDLPVGYAQAVWLWRRVPFDSRPSSRDRLTLSAAGSNTSVSRTISWNVATSERRITRTLAGKEAGTDYDFRFERRDRQNRFLGTITRGIFAEGSIDLNNNRPITRRARFRCDPDRIELDPLTDCIAPIYQVKINGDVWQEWQVGLFRVDAPKESVGPGGTVWDLNAMDVARYLVDRKPGGYEVAAGTSLVTALQAILDMVGLRHSLPPSDKLAAEPMVWDADADLLAVANGVANAMGSYSIWPRADGLVVTRPYSDISQRTPDVAYDDGGFILSPPIEVEPNWNRFANVVTVVSRSATGETLRATARNEDPTSKASTVGLGYEVGKVLTQDGVADLEALERIARQRVQEASSMYSRLTIVTRPDPRRDANEVYSITAGERWVNEAYQQQDWTWDIGRSQRMTHHISRVERVA